MDIDLIVVTYVGYQNGDNKTIDQIIHHCKPQSIN